MGTVLAIYAVFAVAVVTPGPDVVLVLHQGLRHGRRAALLAGTGVVTSIAVWCILAVTGLGALARDYPQVMRGLQLAGAAVLLWMAWGAIRSGMRAAALRSAPTSADAADQVAEERRAPRPWLMGFLTNLSNPKALITFSALFAPFFKGVMGWPQQVAVVVGVVLIAQAWFSTLAWCSSTPRLAGRLMAREHLVELVAGVVFLLLAVLVVVEALR